VFGADFEAPNFMNKPTSSAIDQLAFTVHFAANQTAGSNSTNEASMKIDQRVGNWNLDSEVVDGREQNSSGVMVPVRGNDVLANRSMALNYYVIASSSMSWGVRDDKGATVNNNNVTESSRFDIKSQLSNVNFASVKIGSTYDWSKPTTSTDTIRTFNVTSKTSPVETFQASYQSDSGKSSTGFDISSSMYFLTTGFPSWDGYGIYNDPEVSLLVSKGTDIQTQPNPNPNPNPQPPTNTTNTTNTNTQTNNNGQSNTPSTQPVTEPPTQPPTEPPKEPPTTPPTNPTSTPGIDMTLVIVGIAVGAAVAVGAVLAVRARKK
jgi:hypothetical protein